MPPKSCRKTNSDPLKITTTTKPQCTLREFTAWKFLPLFYIPFFQCTAQKHMFECTMLMLTSQVIRLKRVPAAEMSDMFLCTSSGLFPFQLYDNSLTWVDPQCVIFAFVLLASDYLDCEGIFFFSYLLRGCCLLKPCGPAVSDSSNKLTCILHQTW